jgi:hypothetical protein
MSLCSLGMNNASMVCKYGFSHREKECAFCAVKKEHDLLYLSIEVDIINKSLKKLELLVKAHEEHLKKIDSIALCDPDKVMANEKIIFEKIKNLESKFEDFIQKSSLVYEKQPFKCPVCEGERFRHTEYHGPYPCISCEGKGIIWG